MRTLNDKKKDSRNYSNVLQNKKLDIFSQDSVINSVGEFIY